MHLSLIGGRLRALVFMAAMVSTAMVGVLISGAPSMLALEAQFSLAQLISSACF